MKPRRLGCGLVFAFALFAGVSSSARDITNDDTAKDEAPVQAQRALWVDEKWPFPIDQWGTGLAFRCGAEDCGSEMHLYLRAKIGFCRCATGVSDDDEIDRVGDLELIGPDYKPLAPGHAVTAGIMSGRARLFAVERPLRGAKRILTIALANKCDAIVATIAPGPDTEAIQETNALDFLRSAGVQHWVEAQHSSE
jgi:hypothetical protein